jgi:opacity protein-like surface antigen
MKINKVLMAVLTVCSFANVSQLVANDTVFSNTKSSTDSFFKGSSYKQVGFERLEIELENQFKVDGVNMFTATYGYRLTDNISLEFFGSLPLSSKKEAKFTDTFINQITSSDGEPVTATIDVDGDGDFETVPVYDDDETRVEHTNNVEVKYFTGVNLKLDFPIHESFDLFVTAGYTHAKINYKGKYNNFIDNPPAENPQLAFLNGDNDCEITGKEDESFCNNIPNSFSENYANSGYSYGAGFRFYYANNTTINFHWKKMEYNDNLSVESLSANLEWVF